MKTLIFSLFVFFSCSNLFAQNSAFKVLLTEGTNTFGQNQFITIGTEIPENQTITFEGEYLALMDSEGKAIEITEKGIYEMKDLKGKMNFQANSLWRNYSQEKKFYFEKEPIKGEKTGSISHLPMLVEVCMPTVVTIYQNHLIVSWFPREEKYAKKDIKFYRFYFLDLAYQILTTYETTEDKILINLTDSLFQKSPNRLIYKVIAINQKGEETEENTQVDGFMLEKLEPTDHQTITKEISQISIVRFCPN